MLSALLVMVFVVVSVLTVFTVVAVGIGGRGGQRASVGFVHVMERAADHLNGDAEPPAALAKILR